MNNHERIKNYIDKTQYFSDRNFCYKDVLKVSNTILESTSYSGKTYAVLKFLQIFCTPEHVDKYDITCFCTGDPRQCKKIHDVKNNWQFNLKKNINNSSSFESMNTLGDHVNSLCNVMPTDYSEFVKFLSSELSTHEEKHYEWCYSIRDSVNWLQDDLRQGNTLSQAENVLAIAGSRLKHAIDNNMEQLCFESIRLIMDWGGVYYPQGIRKGNQGKIEKFHHEHILLEKVIAEYRIFINGNIDNISLMNAGWTKVWSVMFPEKFIMFDSRVSFAFTNLLAKFCENDNKKNGCYVYPNKLGYRQIKQGHRCVDGFRSINNNPKYWAKSMIVSSHILKLCLSYAQAERLDISRYNPPSLRSIEARLFMMGA